MKRILALATAVSFLLLLAVGCGDAGADMSGAEYDWGGNGGGGSGGGGQEPGGWADATASEDYGAPPAPEVEFDFDLKAPQASQHYVYIAATARDSLVRITADESLDIRLIPVGGQPTALATLPGQDVALVINSGTQDFSIVRSSPDKDQVKTLDILPHVNMISIAPNSKYAIVYYNDKAAEKDDPVGDFQTVNVVNVQQDKEEVFEVSTGFHTTAVYFHQTQPVAYLVTDDGVGILDLSKATNGHITPIVPVSDDPLEDAEMREVLVTGDGAFAVSRHLALPHINIIDLVDPAVGPVKIPVKGLPTDVDLIPGSDQALLVLREQERAYVVDLGTAVAAEGPTELAEAVVEIDISGSMAGAAVVTADGRRAVMYTTVGSTKAVGVMALDEEDYVVNSFPVQKAVLGVAVSNAGNTGLVFHALEGYAADASAKDKKVAASNGFTLFNLGDGYRKLIQTDHKWSSHLFVSDEDGADLKLFVLTPDPSGLSHQVVITDLGNYLAKAQALPSQPTSMVFVPSSRTVAVAQDHANGRITFIDVDDGKSYSVTGYELNGLIH